MSDFVPLSQLIRGDDGWTEGLFPTGGDEFEAPEPPEPDGLESLRTEVEAAARKAEAQRLTEHKAAMAAVTQRQKSLEEAEARVVEIARQLQEERNNLVKEARGALGGLIFEAARRIAGEALRVDPGMLDALVDEGVRALGDEGLVIRVSAADAARLRSRLEPRGIKVIADPKVTGGCLCEGPAGRIDASLGAAEAAVGAVLDQWKRR
jgi:flagellar biosynthesis/type III secretory pathway protein FliH